MRPDGYVACSTSDLQVIANYLDELTRPKSSKRTPVMAFCPEPAKNIGTHEVCTSE